MISTYLLQSDRDRTYYVGISKDPIARLLTHNAGRVLSTKRRLPWRLIYSKEHRDYAEARKHERWLKKKNVQYKSKLVGGWPRPE